MTLFREIDIEWKGETYSFTPSMRLLHTIEAKNDLSVMRAVAELAEGRPKLSAMSAIIGATLRFAGAKVSDEEVAQEIMYGPPDDVVRLYNGVVEALLPPAPDPGKQKAPGGKSGRAKT